MKVISLIEFGYQQNYLIIAGTVETELSSWRVEARDWALPEVPWQTESY